MKAIYILLVIAPIYLYLVIGDFIYKPINLVMPLSVLLVCAWQIACPNLIKRAASPGLINLVGSICAAAAFVYGWYVTLMSGLDAVQTVIVLVLWSFVVLGGFAHMSMHYDKNAVSLTAAGGLAILISGVLIELLLLITGKDLFVFFAVSLVPLTLVLFFYSITILVKRPQGV